MAELARDLRLDDIDYPLPDERIAQVPIEPRDASRMLLVHADGTLEDRVFHELPAVLRSGDLLVANETRVRHARLRGRRDTGGGAEILVLQPRGPDTFLCLVRPNRRLPVGARVEIADELVATVLEPEEGHDGARGVRFEARDGDVAGAIERCGVAPLPPYITAPLDDSERYQTVYARGEGVSAAAPTAGLHFTAEVHRALAAAGIGWTTLRLEVGIGTFAPIREDIIARHSMHRERFDLPAETAELINQTRSEGGRVVAVGTTSVRVLESCAGPDGVVPQSGETRLYITPGYRFSAIDGLLTNFHQPRSSLIAMVAALIGLERWRASYRHALEGDYRFLSFGDCMLAWRPR